MQRFARFLYEVEQSTPPDNPLSDQYRKVFEYHDGKIFPIVRLAVKKMRERFIAKNLNHSEPARNVEVAEESVGVHDNENQLDVIHLEPGVGIHGLSHSGVEGGAHERRIRFA